MTHAACESKLRSVVTSSMHSYPGNWVAIGHAVVYYARGAHAFSAGIKCRHCRSHCDEIKTRNWEESLATIMLNVDYTLENSLLNSVTYCARYDSFEAAVHAAKLISS